MFAKKRKYWCPDFTDCTIFTIFTIFSSQLWITEDTSRRHREQRQELIKFSREVHKRFPAKHCEIKYDKLYVDNEVYVWSEKQQRIERISSSHQHPGMPFQPVPQKYAKTLLGIDESELQSR